LTGLKIVAGERDYQVPMIVVILCACYGSKAHLFKKAVVFDKTICFPLILAIHGFENAYLGLRVHVKKIFLCHGLAQQTALLPSQPNIFINVKRRDCFFLVEKFVMVQIIC
jgi:hypothetical protein